jgi:hypothetical protein
MKEFDFLSFLHSMALEIKFFFQLLYLFKINQIIFQIKNNTIYTTELTSESF